MRNRFLNFQEELANKSDGNTHTFHPDRAHKHATWHPRNGKHLGLVLLSSFLVSSMLVSAASRPCLVCTQTRRRRARQYRHQLRHASVPDDEIHLAIIPS